MIRALITTLLLVLSLLAQAQQISDSLHKKRLRAVVASEVGLYTVSMSGLYVLWYKDYGSSGFRFFNDGNEWQGMDKIGHATTSYYIGMLGIEVLDWTGLEHRKSVWYGGMLGWTFLATVEVFDGFSDEWGFSWPDIGANTFGAGLVIGQELAWEEQRILMKFSYTPTDYPKYRPDLLGDAWNEQILKDYNGQTYWLSGNIKSFLNESSRFPAWLNVAVGYGADGMLGGSSNPETYDGVALPSYKRSSQLYLSLDVDLRKIPTKKKWLRATLNAVGFLKFPAPTLEFRTDGRVIAHGIYW